MSDRGQDTPLWLSHHWPEHHERCVSVGRRHLCRRCSVLYPLAALTAVVVALVEVPTQLLLATMWLLPAPMAIDWAFEHVGRLRYSAPRQVLLTAIGAPALGVALGIHAQQPFSFAAVAPVAFWVLACAVIAVAATTQSAASGNDWEERHDAAETARSERLARLLDSDEQLRSPR
jgi:hypothetical protein